MKAFMFCSCDSTTAVKQPMAGTPIGFTNLVWNPIDRAFCSARLSGEAGRLFVLSALFSALCSLRCAEWKASCPEDGDERITNHAARRSRSCVSGAGR